MDTSCENKRQCQIPDTKRNVRKKLNYSMCSELTILEWIQMMRIERSK